MLASIVKEIEDAKARYFQRTGIAMNTDELESSSENEDPPLVEQPTQE